MQLEQKSGFFARWLKKIIIESIRAYFEYRPRDVIRANRNPTILDYHYYPGTIWINSHSNEMFDLKHVEAKWEKQDLKPL